jgi:hypothetical protein
MRRFFLALVGTAAAAFALDPPTALTVVSATNKQVKLAWAAGGNSATQYLIERRTLESTTYGTVATIVPDNNKVLATTYTDAAFDPFTAYVYRVRGVNTTPLPADVSSPTNEVTAGPPPYGYTRVVPTPDNLLVESTFGHHAEMALDPSGDPVLAWLFVDPNGDGDTSDSEIWALRWDRAHYTWTSPVRVAVPGSIESTGNFAQGFRLAVDRSTGAIGIAYLDRSVPMTWSLAVADSGDGGVTWRTRTLATDDAGSYTMPALALGAGKVHLTFYHDFDGIHYRSGKLADDPTTWSDELVPLLGASGYGPDSDVALDADGNPGVAYLVYTDDGHDEMFYRPGGNAAVANASSEGPADFWQLRLAFAGDNPSIAFAGQLDDQYFADYDHSLFLLTSADGGATWKGRLNIKSDGNTSISGPIDIAFDSKGLGAIVTEENGGNSTGVVCGLLKLSLSDSSGAWKTCGITATYTSGAESPNVRFVANDTMYMAFQTPTYPFDSTTGLELPAGVYFWRGPIGFTFPTAPPPQQ